MRVHSIREGKKKAHTRKRKASYTYKRNSAMTSEYGPKIVVHTGPTGDAENSDEKEEEGRSVFRCSTI